MDFTAWVAGTRSGQRSWPRFRTNYPCWMSMFALPYSHVRKNIQNNQCQLFVGQGLYAVFTTPVKPTVEVSTNYPCWMSMFALPYSHVRKNIQNNQCQ
ncbi:hypothetical protein J6590_020989 [Homalodisca vitripennis]|nr:hypothetical protein J6590_020989 [Homalodisca vitripennis]